MNATSQSSGTDFIFLKERDFLFFLNQEYSIDVTDDVQLKGAVPLNLFKLVLENSHPQA